MKIVSLSSRVPSHTVPSRDAPAWIPSHSDTRGNSDSYQELDAQGKDSFVVWASWKPGRLISFSVPKSRVCCMLREGMGEKTEASRTISSSGSTRARQEADTFATLDPSLIPLPVHTHPSDSAIWLNILPPPPKRFPTQTPDTTSASSPYGATPRELVSLCPAEYLEGQWP